MPNAEALSAASFWESGIRKAAHTVTMVPPRTVTLTRPNPL